MLGLALVRPLDESWRKVLDAVGRSRGWPTSQDVARLAERVTQLSAAYNDPQRARAGAREAGAARLGFSFARDVPKGAAAVRELLAAGAMPREGPLRVLDLGAGLGAMTWGLSRARAAWGAAGAVEATWVDGDGEAVDLAMAIVRERARQAEGAEPIAVTPVKREVRASPDALAGCGAFDLVFVGHLLSELDVGEEPGARAIRHAAWLQALLRHHVAPTGSLVVVEPALRDRTRHLHRIHDAIVASGGFTVFAPCTHSSACPALPDERDWCHEDLRVDLPPWLVPVARAAGLRHEGLTFSYLVLRRDGETLGHLAAAPHANLLRVVSDPIKSKGRLDAFLCGELAAARGGREVGRVRAIRLDRDAADTNRGWAKLARGDVLDVAPLLDARRPRVASSSRVAVLGEGDARALRDR